MARKQPPGDDPNSFANKLDRLIAKKARGRNDAEIAEAAGMDARAFSRIRTGTVSNPRYDTIMAILKAIGADLCDFHRA